MRKITNGVIKKISKLTDKNLKEVLRGLDKITPKQIIDKAKGVEHQANKTRSI